MPVLSCSTLCFRAQPVETALDEIRRAGFASVDLAMVPGYCDHFPAATATPAEREDFVALVRASGLVVAAVTASPGHFNGTASEGRVVEAARGYLKVAAQLGAPIVNLPCGLPQPDPLRHPADLERQAAGLKRIAREAAALGLWIAVEGPHPHGLSRTVSDACALVAAIGEPNVRHLLDTSHVQAAGSAPADAVAEFGGRIGHVHLRDARGGDVYRVPGTGEIDFATFFAALDATGYGGACAIELEGPAETLDERRRAVETARDLLIARGGGQLHAVAARATP